MFIKTVFAFIAAHIIGFFSPNPEVYIAPPVQSPMISTTATSSISTTTKKVATSTNQNNSKKPNAPPVVKKVEDKKLATTTKPTPTPPPPSIPLPDFEKVNEAARPTVVNILCTTKGSELSPISGTGVIITDKGVILTNAHIGQYLLLKDFRGKNNIDCVIRTGSPAYPQYKTELMYISPTWIKDNSDLIKSTNPKGTGENDFAFLYITEKIDGSKLPDGFTYVEPDTREFIEKEEPVILISYPAGFLGGLSILQGLNVTSSITTIQDFFTFKQNTIDLISVGGTIVSQKGSSGGAVIDKYVTLLGIITTSSLADSTKDRELNAITLAHINRSLKSELGMDLSTFLYQDPAEASKTFASTTAPLLTKILTNILSN